MSGPAHYPAFKSQTLALIDQLHLTPEEVIGLGLSLAASYTVTHGFRQAAVADALEASFTVAKQGLPGIVTLKGADN